MITHDQFNNQIEMHYKNSTDKANGEHVLIIPFYQDEFVLTRHKKRGIEFPGGKIEAGETSEAAAERELFEETGALIQQLQYIAQYTVYYPTGERWFTKDVFAAKVKSIQRKEDYLETAGPVMCRNLNDIADKDKSFLLTDEVILKCAERVSALGLYQ